MVAFISIMKLAIKQCFKTCFAWLLLLLSILCIVGTIGRGDEPDVIRQICLYWLPMGVLTIFCVGVIWMGCSSMANDIEEKRFIGTAVAPVKRSTIWFGRWLGLLASAAFLLAIVFVLIGINGVIRLGSARPCERLELLPEAREAAVQNIYIEMLNSLSKDADSVGVSNLEQKEEVLSELRKQIRWQYFPLHAGGIRSWDFSLDGLSLRAGEMLQIKLSFLSSIGTTGGADGTLKVYAIAQSKGDELLPVEEYVVSSESRGNVWFDVPSNALLGASAIRVEFENATEQEDGATILVGYEESLQVFAPKEGYWSNLLYAYLMCLGLLSIMAAMGITSGMQYSFPVAIFSALVVMLMLVIASGDAIGEYTGEAGHSHSEEEEEHPALFADMLRVGAQGASRVVHYITATYIEEEPLAKLGANRLISCGRVGAWSIVSFVILPLLLCGIGSLVLSKKEFK